MHIQIEVRAEDGTKFRGRPEDRDLSIPLPVNGQVTSTALSGPAQEVQVQLNHSMMVTSHSNGHCRGCSAFPDPGLKFLVCKACTVTPYCSAACQRADWKSHKYICLRIQNQRTTHSEKTKLLFKKMHKWVDKHNQALYLAGFEALLPSLDYLPYHLLNTHGMLYDLEETLDGFRLISAQIKTRKFFYNMYEKEEEIAALKCTIESMNKTKKQRNACCPPEEEVVGWLFCVVRCGDDWMPEPVSVERERLDLWRTKKHEEDWEGWLKRNLSQDQVKNRKMISYTVPPGMAVLQ